MCVNTVVPYWRHAVDDCIRLEFVIKFWLILKPPGVFFCITVGFVFYCFPYASPFVDLVKIAVSRIREYVTNDRTREDIWFSELDLTEQKFTQGLFLLDNSWNEMYNKRMILRSQHLQ